MHCPIAIGKSDWQDNSCAAAQTRVINSPKKRLVVRMLCAKFSARCERRWWIPAPAPSKRYHIMGAKILLLLSLFITQPAGAEQYEATDTLLELRELDKRVLAIGHRLAVANADLCADRAIATGVVLHTLAQYGRDYRQAVASAFSLGAYPGVLAVASGSRAEEAGLRENDQIVKVDARELPSTSAGPKRDFSPTAAATDLLERELADGFAEFQVVRADQTLRIPVTAEQGCPSRFQVVPSRAFTGKADGNYVQLSSQLVQRVERDEELAAVLSHELSHNILRHKSRLSEAGVKRGLLRYFGRNASQIKETEIEADRLSVYLLYRAGYPPEAAEAFWRRFGPQHPWGPFGSPTHPGWRSRADALNAEVDELRRRVSTGASLLPDFLILDQGRDGDNVEDALRISR